MKSIFLFLLACCVASSLRATTYTCPSCSQSDFENILYHQAVNGDTIVLPAGSATWGNSARFNSGILYITQNITVQGQGDTTVITLDDSGATYANGVIAIWSASTFANMKIVGSNVNPVTAFQVSPYKTFTGGFRITNVTFAGGKSDGYFCYIGAGITNGLIDSCRISGNSGSTELIFGRGPANAWQTANTMGGPNNIFIEDNTFNTNGYVCDANANAQFVVRFNTINGPNKIDGHGIASNTPPRSFRNMEVYGNHWTNNGSSWTAIEIRGGTSMVFNNIADTTNGTSAAWFFLTDYGYQSLWGNFGTPITNVTAGNPPTFTTASPHGLGANWPILVYCPKTTPTINGAFGATVKSPVTFSIPVSVTAGGAQTGSVVERYMTAADYPIADQVGVGKDPKVAGSEPAYVWNNKKNGSAWTRNFWNPAPGALALYKLQTANASATFGEADVIRSNRDFFADGGFDTNTGVAVGTASQMNAMKPTVKGYGFWVTDQGKWNGKTNGPDGQLYVWNGSAWALKYTPYTYPHPARQLPPPTGLHVITQ